MSLEDYKKHFKDLPKFKGANCEPLACGLVKFSVELQNYGTPFAPIVHLLFVSLLEYNADFPNRIDLVDVSALENRYLQILEDEYPDLKEKYDQYLDSLR